MANVLSQPGVKNGLILQGYQYELKSYFGAHCAVGTPSVSTRKSRRENQLDQLIRSHSKHCTGNGPT
jgi:hypothetical protein